MKFPFEVGAYYKLTESRTLLIYFDFEFLKPYGNAQLTNILILQMFHRSVNTFKFKFLLEGKVYYSYIIYEEAFCFEKI